MSEIDENEIERIEAILNKAVDEVREGAVNKLREQLAEANAKLRELRREHDVVNGRVQAALNILPNDGNQGRVDRAREYLEGKREPS